jgi:hypothetical protein
MWSPASPRYKVKDSIAVATPCLRNQCRRSGGCAAIVGAGAAGGAPLPPPSMPLSGAGGAGAGGAGAGGAGAGLGCEDDVLSLEVAMHHVLLVQVVRRQHHLPSRRPAPSPPRRSPSAPLQKPYRVCGLSPTRPRRHRGQRGAARLREDGEGIVLFERPLGQQVLEQLAAAQALLRRAHTRACVAVGASGCMPPPLPPLRPPLKCPPLPCRMR